MNTRSLGQGSPLLGEGRPDEEWVAMTDFTARAARFVSAHFPLADAAFLGGSAATADATDSSDLDILVVLPTRWSEVAFVETTRFEGQLVEAFVYGPEALRLWLDKGRDDRFPVLDRLIGEGVPLTGGLVAQSLGDESRRVLRDGPEEPDPAALSSRVYSLSAALDDMVDATHIGERFVISSTAWREAAELALAVRRRWLGTGKWLLRELTAETDEFGLAAWAGSDHDPSDLEQCIRAVLDAAGGYVQEPFIRGQRPSDL